MKAEFAFDVDPAHDLVRIRMAGFFTHADIADFMTARRLAHAQLTCPPNAHLTLNDISGMSLQAQSIVDSFQEMLAEPEYRSRRLAFVVGNNIARGQAIRALESRAARWFNDAQQAEAWLLAEEPAQAPLRRAG